jgi:DNA-binding PadR family transcriptional regulator
MKIHLGEFEQLLLLALVRLGDGAYGVAIRQEIEKRTGRMISAGAVYTALDRMESRGFVSSKTGEPTAQRGGRRKKHYKLEPAGAKALSRSYQAIRDMVKGMEPRLSRLSTSDSEV